MRPVLTLRLLGSFELRGPGNRALKISARKTRALLVTTGNPFLEAALKLDSHVELSVMDPASFERASAERPDAASGVATIAHRAAIASSSLSRVPLPIRRGAIYTEAPCKYGRTLATWPVI